MDNNREYYFSAYNTRSNHSFFSQIIILALLVGLFLFMSSCAPLPAMAATNVIYRYDMILDINGQKFVGVGVIPYDQQYNMKITSRQDIDLLTISSCHRDLSIESAIKQGWFESKRGYSYAYVPNTIERGGSCVLRLGSYNKDHEDQNVWGIVDFENPAFQMPAINTCNGELIKSNGVSICQSKSGLIQQIIFEKKMGISSVPCQVTTKDGYVWEYRPNRDECVVLFREVDGKRLHKLTMIGYDRAMIRGN